MNFSPEQRRNADSKVYKAPGPRGTPLQFAWRCFHSPKARPDQRTNRQKVLRLLMDSGADTDWTEPHGAIVNKATIEAWCALSQEQLASQSEFNYAFCEAGWYNYRYPLSASQSDIDMYRCRQCPQSEASDQERRAREHSTPSTGPERADQKTDWDVWMDRYLKDISGWLDS